MTSNWFKDCQPLSGLVGLIFSVREIAGKKGSVVPIDQPLPLVTDVQMQCVAVRSVLASLGGARQGRRRFRCCRAALSCRLGLAKATWLVIDRGGWTRFGQTEADLCRSVVGGGERSRD